MLVRTALGLICASAIVTGSLGPAAAGAGSNDLDVRICKQVESHGRMVNEFFVFQTQTRRDSKQVRLENTECERFKLDFRKSQNVFALVEVVDKDRWSTKFSVRGDVEKTEIIAGVYPAVRVEFDTSEADPRLRIDVTNELKTTTPH
jgi:hypothetical protein